MDEQEVVELMKSSKSQAEWTANCKKVKAACGGGYPACWLKAIIISGLINMKFPEDPEVLADQNQSTLGF